MENNHFANSNSGTYKHLAELAKIQKKYLEKFVYVDEDNSPEDVFSVQEEKAMRCTGLCEDIQMN